MNIRTARKIADLVDTGHFNGFKQEVRQAFHALDRSADKGNRDDRRLAKFLWDEVGKWNVEAA